MQRLAGYLLAAAVAVLTLGALVVGSIESAPSNRFVAPARAPAVDVELRASDGLRLAGTFWSGPKSGAPGVLLLHGNGSSRQSLVRGAEWLHELGYAVLTLDLRGHGQSAPAQKSFGYFEARDAAAGVQWLRGKQSSGKIVVIGSSLGGAAALVGEGGPVAADGMILQAVYPDIRSAVRNRIAQRTGALAAAGLEPWLSYQSRMRLGVWPNRLSPIEAIRRYHGPVLVIGGGSDRYTPPSETRALFVAAPGPKRLWIAKGRGHNGMIVAGDLEWKTEVEAFLVRYFPSEPAFIDDHD